MNLIVRLFRLRTWTSLITVLLFLPFDIIVGLSIFLSDLSYLFLRILPNPRSGPPPQAINRETASVVVLNWDGKHLLEEYLPSVVSAVRQDGRAHEILVVDNGSTDGSVEFLKACFPEVRVVPLSHNMRYTGGNNAGLRAAQHDIVIFLNNDMQVDPGFIRPLLEGFNSPDIFSVSCQVFFQDKERRREETGKTRARWRWGFMEPYHDQIQTSDRLRKYVPIFWGGGGSCAFDKKKIQAIGGLDRLYDPFYLEDTDLSYQAWKRGWRSLLAVDSTVVHRHRGTNKLKFGDNYVDNMIRKNQYLFIWKNVTAPNWILQHCVLLPLIQARLIHQTTVFFEVRAFLRALIQLPEALYKRQRNRNSYVYSDPAIFRESAYHYPEKGTSHVDFSQSDFAEQLGDGWYGLEHDGKKGFRWTAARCLFFLFSQGNEKILEVCVTIPEISRYRARSQKMVIYQNGKRIHEVHWSHSEEKVFQVSIDKPKTGPQAFELCLSHSFCPARAGKSDDTRELGVIVSAMRLI